MILLGSFIIEMAHFKWEQMLFSKSQQMFTCLFCKLAWRLIFSSYMTLIHLLVTSISFNLQMKNSIFSSQSNLSSIEMVLIALTILDGMNIIKKLMNYYMTYTHF